MEKILIIHHNDMDGRAAAYVIINYLESKGYDFDSSDIKLVENNYSNLERAYDFDSIDDNTIVYAVDYSFTNTTIDLLNKIIRMAKQTIWIDHHATSCDVVNEGLVIGEYDGIVDSRRSGAYLAYEYILKQTEGPDYVIKKKDIPNYIKFVDDYDRWIHKFPSMAFNYAMQVYGGTKKFYPFKRLQEVYESNGYDAELKVLLDVYVKQGTSYMEYMKACYMNRYISDAYLSEIDGVDCIAINATGNSEVFAGMLPNHPCGVRWHYSDDMYHYSIYSDKDSDVNCAKIAEKFGGGGHPHAAGFSSKELVIQ